MRVLLLRDYKEHRAGTSLIVPTNEGDWLISIGFARDPGMPVPENKTVSPTGVESKTFGDPLRIPAAKKPPRAKE